MSAFLGEKGPLINILEPYIYYSRKAKLDVLGTIIPRCDVFALQLLLCLTRISTAG